MRVDTAKRAIKVTIYRHGREAIDYANIMRGAVEVGPPFIRRHGYFFK